VFYHLAGYEADLLWLCISIASSSIMHRQSRWWLPFLSPPLLLLQSLMASAIRHLCMLQLSHLKWHLARIAWSHSFPWLLPCKFKWKLTLLKVLFHYFLPLSEFVRAWGWALKAQRKQVNPLREELYNEQMSSQGWTAGFVTWTIQKRGGKGGNSWL